MAAAGGPKHAQSPFRQAPSDQRPVQFLAMLAEELNGTSEIQARVMVRGGCQVVFVSNYSCNLRMADISCDFTNDGWWFTWVADGRTIGPAADMAGVAESVVTYLHRPMSL